MPCLHILIVAENIIFLFKVSNSYPVALELRVTNCFNLRPSNTIGSGCPIEPRISRSIINDHQHLLVFETGGNSAGQIELLLDMPGIKNPF